MSTRDSVNRDFYGRPVAARQLLLGETPSTYLAAQPLYAALDDLLLSVGQRPSRHALLCCTFTVNRGKCNDTHWGHC